MEVIKMIGDTFYTNEEEGLFFDVKNGEYND